MAGVLLLLMKKNKNISGFYERKERLINFLNTYYQPYFQKINIFSESEYHLTIKFDNRPNKDSYKESTGSWLAYEGSVFALHETKLLFAEDIWGLYQKLGEKFSNYLDGHFVIKLFDAAKHHYLILNDFIRSRTNYLSINNDYIMVSPFLLPTAISQKPKLDYHAFNELMWRYYILSDRTILNGVRRLKPASIYIIKENGNINRKQYWNFPKKLSRLTFKEAVESTKDSIKETAQLLSRGFGKCVSDLTLGQDSRLIVSAFKKQNLPIATTIFGKNDFFEAAEVKKITEKHHIEHHNIQLSNYYYSNNWDYFKKSILLGGVDEPGYLLGRILYMRDQQSKYGNALINGSGGPFYKDCFWEETYLLNLYKEPRKINYKKFLHLRPMNKNYPDDIFKDNFISIKNNSAEYFIKMLENEIAGYEGCPVSMQIDKFALTLWQNYAVFANSVTNTLYTSFSPLLFRRNLEISVNLPTKWRWNKSNYQRAIMYQIAPEMAREKTDFGGINMVPKNVFTFIPFYIRYLYQQSDRFTNKIKNKIGLPTKTRLQEAWDYVPVYKNLYRSRNIRELINYKEMVLSEIIKERQWQNLIDRYETFTDLTQENYEYLLKILSVELFLRKAMELHP